MSFLEFVCAQLLGPPVRVKGHGEAFWDCPYCGNTKQKFHTRTLSNRYPKQRYGCYKCGEWGDEWNLIEDLYPDEDHAQHVRRWKMLREEWEALDPAECLTVPGQRRQSTTQPVAAIDFISQGRQGRLSAQDRGGRCEGDGQPADSAARHRALLEAPRRLVSGEWDILMHALRIARREGCDLTELAEHICQLRAIDEEHLAACQDPECEWLVCRRARGLPPLTGEEKQELWAQARDERRRFNEEAVGLSPAGRKHACGQQKRESEACLNLRFRRRCTSSAGGVEMPPRRGDRSCTTPTRTGPSTVCWMPPAGETSLSFMREKTRIGTRDHEVLGSRLAR
jgi:hypothetical protein